MICFPDLDALRLALGRGVIPPAVARTAARAGVSVGGKLFIHPAPILAPEAETALHALGATRAEVDETLLDRDICCWQQLVPLAPEGIGRFNALPLPAAEPVLFELLEPCLWFTLAAEFRRLRKPFPSYRWAGEESDGPILLRSADPPQTVLIHAGDQTAGLRAYHEQATRVWVEVGWRQPQVEQIVPPVGKLILICRSSWTVHDDGPFEEEIAEFPVPAAPALRPVAVEGRPCSTQLRLVPERADRPVEFWVLRDQPLEQLAALIRDLDDDLLSRLEFAAAEQGGQRLVAVRIRQSRRAGAVVVIPGLAFSSYLRLPNLFLPTGWRLQPTIRRDAVRRLLADDPDRVVWLTPLVGGQFQRESLPAASFRPLAECVHYVAGREQRPLRAWSPTARFEFESFASHETTEPFAQLRKSFAAHGPAQSGFLDRLWAWCRETFGSQPPVLPHGPTPPHRREFLQAAPAAVASTDHPVDSAPGHVPAAAAAVEQPEPAAVPPRHVQMEKRLLDLGGPLDLPQRQALWPELAALYHDENNWRDAAVCWRNALWESAGNDLWTWGWLHAEEQSARWTELERDLQRVLNEPRPESADVHALAALIVFCARHDEPPSAVSCRLDRIRACLEANEGSLPVRSVWLAWLALARLSGGDVLCLARARDRLLDRLFRRGLSHRHDLPSFMRGEGPDTSKRTLAVRNWLVQLPDLLGRWIDRLPAGGGWGEPLHPDSVAASTPATTGLLTERWLGKPPPYGRDAEPFFTKALCNLTVAWGLARVGETAQGTRLTDRAREVLAPGDAIHRFLLNAYVQRISESAGRADAPGPLPRAGIDLTVEMRYKIDWLLLQSRILEPEPTHAGSTSTSSPAAVGDAFSTIRSLINIAEQTEQMNRVLSHSEHAHADQSSLAPVLAHALSRAPYADEDKARGLLDLVEPTVRELTDQVAQVRLIGRGLVVAAHFGLREQLQLLAAHLEQLLERHRGPDNAVIFESLAEVSFRGLRRLGMAEQIDRLLARVGERILPAPWGNNAQAPADIQLSPAGWRGLLHVAAGWFGAGQEKQAFFVLEQVRDLLVKDRLPPKQLTALACAYATALGQAPLAPALERLEQLFAELGRIHFKHTTNSHYSLAILGVVEAVVRAVADDDFAVETRLRRWLDEDEYRVRRRIHDDLRVLMGQAGIQ